MITAILTDDGAKRLGVPHLAGAIVRVDELLNDKLANNIYYEGKRLGAVLSYTGDDAGLQLQEAVNAA